MQTGTPSAISYLTAGQSFTEMLLRQTLWRVWWLLFWLRFIVSLSNNRDKIVHLNVRRNLIKNWFHLDG